MDSGADTFVTGKHTWVSEIIEGTIVSAKGFNNNLPIIENSPMVNAIYAYDDESTGGVIILEINHCIYMIDNKDNAIACPNQMCIHDIHLDDRPSIFSPHEDNTQYIIADGIKMPLISKGPLTFLPICRSTQDEMKNDNLQIIQLTSPHGWDPYGDDSFSKQNKIQINFGCTVSTFLSKSLQQILNFGSSKSKTIIPAILAERWGIGIEPAQLTI